MRVTADHPPAAIRLQDLLRRYELGLVLIAGGDDDTPSRPVQWVHVSELEDPAPFLTPRTVLLTTGARFSSLRVQADADAYVARLLAAGVTALGVGVGLHWDRVLPSIVAACDRLGLPLIRVPYDTAFLSIVQAAARLLEAGSRERDIWALEAQRAVASASLHRDGLRSALREAATRLERWVCVTDRSGRIVEFAPQAQRSRVAADEIRREALRLIERGVSAGRIGGESGGLQMQTLGRPGRVLGILVVEDRGTPDSAERALLGLLAALATVQLEHRAGIEAAHISLRGAIVQLLVAGESRLAEKLAATALVKIPQGSLVVLRHPDLEGVDSALIEHLRSLDAATPGLFLAQYSGAPVIVAESRHLPALRRLLAAHRFAAGVSQRGSIDAIAELIEQADRALAIALSTSGDAPVEYAPALHEGVLHLLDQHPQSRRRAEGLLSPIRAHDARHDDAVESSLAAWLGHHGQTSAAASSLGIHRHTLTARIRRASDLLQIDLDSPDARADLWAALRLVGPPDRHSET